jgi:deazaflavin-dependent oxidoreductase (nitroreductase family)
VALPIAGTRWFPLYAILRHTGRTSGRDYATPVVALRTSTGFLIPLPFGDATQWARNVFAAGGGRLRFAGRDESVVEPQVVDRQTAGPDMPRLLRSLAGLVGIREFVRVRRATEVAAACDG